MKVLKVLKKLCLGVLTTISQFFRGVVGCGEGVMYLTSPGSPTDIGLQLGKACYPCSKQGLRGNVSICSVSSLSFLFLFLPCPSLSSPLLSLLSLFFLSLGDNINWSVRVDMSLKPNTINNHNSSYFLLSIIINDFEMVHFKSESHLKVISTQGMLYW